MQTKFFLSSNAKIAYFDEYIETSKIGVIIIHGLAEHKGRYEEFINILNQNNISVFAIDLRGHGQSDGERGDIKYFDDYINDLKTFIDYIKKRYPNLKLALFGHSIGGLVSTNYVTKNNDIDLLILSSPSFETPAVIKYLSLLPEKLLHKIKVKKRHSESKEMLEYSRNDEYACHKFSLGLLSVIFMDGVKDTIRHLNNVKIPVLMLGGSLDPLIDSGKLKFILDKIPCKDKVIKIYKNAKHRIVQNNAKEEAISDIIEWLKVHI